MKNINILLEDYIQAAIAHGEATFAGDYKTVNKQYTKLTGFYKKLEKDRLSAETFLDKLFRHTNASVKTWASAHALGLGIHTEEAIKVLQQVSEDRNIGVIRLDAEMVLKEWAKKGSLKF